MVQTIKLKYKYRHVCNGLQALRSRINSRYIDTAVWAMGLCRVGPCFFCSDLNQFELYAVWINVAEIEGVEEEVKRAQRYGHIFCFVGSFSLKGLKS